MLRKFKVLLNLEFFFAHFFIKLKKFFSLTLYKKNTYNFATKNFTMKVIYWLAILCLIGLNVKAQNKTWKPEFQVNTSYNAYFQQAYGIYDRVPKGILEAISYTQTRIRHIQPKMEQASCIGMPLPTGVMGLFEDGKNYFRSNFKLVQSYSGFSAQELRQNPAAQIMAYAKTYQKLLTEFNIQSNNIQDHIPVLIALSELPTASLLEDFAMDSYLYAVLSIWNDPDFAKQMLYECPKIDLEQIFGPNYYILSASYVTASDSKIQGGGFTYNPYFSASNKTANVDYPSAIWNPTTCNYSSRNGRAITHYTIHTVQGTYSGCISWFKNCSANASAHYVIRSSDGQVTQMVREAYKAWHVGSENPYTIGTEHEGFVSDPAWYTTAMYNSSAALARHIVNSGYGISGLRTYDGPSSSVVTSTGACIKIKGHQHYPNQTHTDPGINWNWPKFYTLVNNNPTVTTFALGKAHLKAFNLNGQLVYSQQNEVNEGYNAMEINVNEWVPGIYFLEITTESGEVSRTKFVVSE